MPPAISSHALDIRGASIHYLETGEISSPALLFLHGASFTARTWQEIGTLAYFADRGLRAIAVDVPGYGNSQSINFPRREFLLELLQGIQCDRPVLVSPSMSGGYSLPFIAEYAEKLSGFVAVAPVGINRYQEAIAGCSLPVLAIWGSNDRIVPPKYADLLVELFPQGQKVILPNAGHACYMRATPEFHQHLFAFLEGIFAI
ncbi:MAG: alpha/beta hydrolase [Cyanobacteria bacterium SBLK]|nr:alpha/beta hydrolase [Cyanobacteria bacterium SBLK]